ncbi:MAG: hypothetical protein GYB65_20205 [Chloroflexi bacterium]|nr:hypothetical protein [Chloroflexota bacterium]
MQDSLKTNSGRGIFAILLIAVGVMALMGIELLWPLFIIVPGLFILSLVWVVRGPAAVLAIPGCIITGTGLLLFAQNLTGYWESWSYAWTLYGVFIGMGFVIMGQRWNQKSFENLGQMFIKVSVVLFIGFAVLMEVIIGVSDGPTLIPLILIGAGIYLVLESAASKKGLFSSWPKQKKKKRGDKIFTGPVVYGSTRPAPSEREPVERES